MRSRNGFRTISTTDVEPWRPHAATSPRRSPRWRPPAAATTRDGATARPLNDLTIDSAELQYLGELGGLLDGNPRALKRFVNTYRLVKLSLSDVELEVFRSPIGMLGGPHGTLPYQLCMAQLAVLCTQRERGLRMVRLADDDPDTLGTCITQVHDEDAELSAFFLRMFAKNISDPHAVRFDTFALWLERTRRYSFYL
jgi:hypothetical protein